MTTSLVPSPRISAKDEHRGTRGIFRKQETRSHFLSNSDPDKLWRWSHLFSGDTALGLMIYDETMNVWVVSTDRFRVREKCETFWIYTNGKLGRGDIARSIYIFTQIQVIFSGGKLGKKQKYN